MKTVVMGLRNAARWLSLMCASGMVPFASAATPPSATAPGAPAAVTFIFTSDLHYGIHRSYFRGEANVESRVVNTALAEKINRLPATLLPADHGLRAGQPIGPIDFVIVTGDITNRQELRPLHIQSATASWRQFEDGFVRTLTLTNARGEPTPLLLVPGNHDASNAIGSPNKMVPERDATAMAEMYNRMMRPAVRRTARSYHYGTDKINFSREFGGVHLVFLTIWPDRAARAWIEEDLRHVDAATPVLLFCHDQPDVEAKHLTNPNGRHDINHVDRFENLLADLSTDGTTVDAPTVTAQRELTAFLKKHPNIVGYFHGNSNWNEFYTWKGPDGDIALPVFRADSSIKGKDSGPNEARLSFQVVTYDAVEKKLTARECLWNSLGRADQPATPVAWGETRTVSLQRRDR